MPTDLTTVRMSRDLVKRIKALRKPHQAFAGVLEELLSHTANACPVSPETMKVLERYRTKPEDTLDDLVQNVLTENAEFEKQIAEKK